MQFLLSDFDRWRFELRARHSALSEAARDGWFRLYNKNASETFHVHPVGQLPDRMVWIVECDTVPAYFRNVLREIQYPLDNTA